MKAVASRRDLAGDFKSDTFFKKNVEKRIAICNYSMIL